MAGPAAARLGDAWAGVCCCHDGCVGMAGVIISSASTVFQEGPQSARLTDITIGACGHVGAIVSSSSTVIHESLESARLGDAVAGCNIGTIVSAASTVFDGG